ncbi:hypothetical protein B0O99DRAFT_614364 [Bisporella sp. PMI_857]|nr:hypothetical protein B0O99DRAFT_614364 [Bisporella sp. PMI_857]
MQVTGNAKFRDYWGIEYMSLKHVDLADFHVDPLSKEVLENGETRFYRWHQDTPLYENLPGKATLLHSEVVPKLPNQEIGFENGEVMELQAGATTFISGARAFQLLSPEQQGFALNTTIQYAPKVYEFIRDCKASSDGLGIANFGREQPMMNCQLGIGIKSRCFRYIWEEGDRVYFRQLKGALMLNR